ncbi:MAG: toxin-antitoxin system HicB family antitoxin [Gemmatimonadetes bacterium]|nr:toxin-antitoxin system HicB family antitoxin [Gemmatimonadota bacterium]
MSQLSLRLPDSLHAAVKEWAARDNVSTNQFVMLAVAEKISALATAEYFARRAARAPSRDRYLALLAKAPAAKSADKDRL